MTQTPDTLFLEPRTLYDPAVVRCSGEGVLVYSADKIIDLLVEYFRATGDEDEETLWDEAAQYFYFNIERKHVGFYTPIYEWCHEEKEYEWCHEEEGRKDLK